MKIYVAGKITGTDRRATERKFQSAAERLAADGHAVFLPCALPDYDCVPHEDYMHVCYAMIDICDAVYMLSDWQTSKGARMELQYAADWRKQIIYEDDCTREPGFPVVRGAKKC